MREIVPDVQMWSVSPPDKDYDFNGYAVNTEEGTVLIDPPEPADDGWGPVDLLEPFAGVWITNRNHSRAAANIRERYGITVYAHEADAASSRPARTRRCAATSDSRATFS